MLVLLKDLHFSVVHQQTCRPRDKNYMILQWKVYVKWTSTFCEKTDDVHAPTKFQQNKHTPGAFYSLKVINRRQKQKTHWYQEKVPHPDKHTLVVD